MNERALILVTNDDGIQSPGLWALAEAVADLGELLVVAPSSQQTGASRSYPNYVDKTLATIHLPLNGKEYSAYSANVSPAQAVALGVLELAPRPINLCISGINYGENIGTGVTISGTVGAAIEAACYDIPALAVSLETPHEYHLNHSDAVDFSAAAWFARQFAKKILQAGLPENVDLIKVDVPASATPDTPWRVGRVSRQRYYHSMPGDYDITADREEQAKGFSYQVTVQSETLEPDSDVKIFSVDKQVAVVPMTIDLTARVALQDISQFLDNA